MNVKRQDLIQQLVERHGYTKKAATMLIDDFTDIILYNLREGNTISIRNFGVFDMTFRAARSCPNPVTGDKCDIPAHWVPKFIPSKNMRLQVRLWEDSEKRGLM